MPYIAFCKSSLHRNVFFHFSFQSTFTWISDPTKATTKHWQSNSGTLVTEKTPTFALVNPDGKTLKAFGYNAENEYRELLDKGEEENYFFFKRFKMDLYCKMGKVRFYIS
jgi:hypothetical protein